MMDDTRVPISMRLKAIFENQDQDYNSALNKIKNIYRPTGFKGVKSVDKYTICGIINFVVDDLHVTHYEDDTFEFSINDNVCTMNLKDSDTKIIATGFIYSSTISLCCVYANGDPVKRMFLNANIKDLRGEYLLSCDLSLRYLDYAIFNLINVILLEYEKFKKSESKSLKEYYDKR